MNKKNGWKETIEWYNQNAQYYADRVQNYVDYETMKKFVSKIKKKSTSPKVLDAGCAARRDSNALKKFGAIPIGIDISHGLIKEAKRRFPGIKFVQGDFRNLSFDSESFDGIWCSASLLHFERLEDVVDSLKEFYRVLKPGGVLYVSVKKKLGKEESGVVVDSLSKAPRFFRWFTKEELVSLLERIGFKEVEIFGGKDMAGRKGVEFIKVFAVKE